MGKNVRKDTTKKLSSRYKQRLLDRSKQYAFKTAEATIDF